MCGNIIETKKAEWPLGFGHEGGVHNFRCRPFHDWDFLYMFIKNHLDTKNLISSSTFGISTVSSRFKTKIPKLEVFGELSFYFC